MASKKQFGGLWGDEDSAAKGAKGSAATNLSGSRFSTRDYAVDQSVNLMALGEEPGTNLSGGAAPSTGGGLASSVAGLFRAKTGTEAPPFNEYGDAAPSTESEEYISDKQRRMTPVVASLRNFMATKAFFSLMLGVLGCGLLGGGIYLAATNIKDDGGATQAQMKQSIIDAGVTSKAVFNAGSSTAQSKALKWLAHDDPAKLAPEDKGFLDRYILATFYFGSNDKLEGWNKNENWMTGKGICSWAGVECVPKSVQPSNSNGFQSEVKSYDANDAITALKLPGNNMEGVIAEEFAGCKNLLILDLSENEISGSIPTQLGEMPKIRDLILHKNTIFGTFPSELTKLKGLHQLLLADNKMEGSLPYAIQNMLNLRTLSLSANSFEGAFPLLKPLKLLANLHLDDNQFRGTLADDLTALTELKDLRLSNNQFEGELPAKINSLRKLEILRMDHNKFTGTIPNWFGSAPRIADLQLHRNQFVGSIPLSIWNLDGLKHLSLDNNKLTGTIDYAIGTLVDVATISLHLNQLEGTIPTQIGFLDDIAILSLSSNKFSGTIPTELGDCFRLKQVTIDQNQFTGQVPTELGKLDRLEEFQLELNSLNGVIPAEVCALKDNEVLSQIVADCKSKLTCSCCDQCL